MKKVLITLALAISCWSVFGQDGSDDYLRLKLQRKENLTVKEWNTDARSKTKWLDRVTVYDSRGRKVEETEYNQYGQAWRETYEYNEQDLKIRETRYNEKNKVAYIRKFEYNPDGTRHRQYTYAPNGKLQTTKVFEYTRDTANE